MTTWYCCHSNTFTIHNFLCITYSLRICVYECIKTCRKLYIIVRKAISIYHLLMQKTDVHTCKRILQHALYPQLEVRILLLCFPPIFESIIHTVCITYVYLCRNLEENTQCSTKKFNYVHVCTCMYVYM